MARALRQGIESLELTTKATLAVLAAASGVYTYLGVRSLLDGSATIVFLGAIIYSAAVSVGIFTFWTYLMRFLPHVRDRGARRALICAMALGSAMIIAMSSWLNAAALAGAAALEQHLAIALEDGAQDLDGAHNNALAAQSLLPDIQLAADRFARLAAEERASGALTGTSGSGTVVQLLTQMSNQLKELSQEVEASRQRVKNLFEQGGEHLARMRRLVSAAGPIAPRSDAFAEETVALAGVVAALQQTSVAPAVRRAAEDLSSAFIAPVASGADPDLRARQARVVGNVAAAVGAQSKALALAADDILAREQVRPARFVPLSTPEAVLRYARDFLPSWAGAISIDLMPAILVLILVAVHAAIRRHENPAEAGNTMTAHDVMTAMRLYDRMRSEDLTATAFEAAAAGGRAEGGGPGADMPLAGAGQPGQSAGPAPERQPAAERSRNVTPMNAPGSGRRPQPVQQHRGGRRDQPQS